MSLAAGRAWICDSTILAAPPSVFRLGPFTIPELSFPGNPADACPDGLFIGAFPAVLVGAVLFLIAASVVLWLVARRPDRLTMLVGLAVLALAFFVLPTRVHERYLFPLAAIGAILAAVSLRWRVAYILSAAATLANMYVVLVHYYPTNPNIRDWLGLGPMLASYPAIAIASITQAAVFAWTFIQLRQEAVEDLAADTAVAGRDPADREHLAPWLGRPALEPDGDAIDRLPRPAGSAAFSATRFPDDGRPDARDPRPGCGAARRAATPEMGRRARRRPGDVGLPAGRRRSRRRRGRDVPARRGAGIAAAGLAGTEDLRVAPRWAMPDEAGALGPWAWFKARLGDRPVRADRSAELDGERGGRLDRLDVWMLVVLAIALLTVRMWRLPEPYQMHFDEVYHPRTATEFLQYWRYGISHDIYEWTHPHMAKYAMALGIEAFARGQGGRDERSRRPGRRRRHRAAP